MPETRQEEVENHVESDGEVVEEGDERRRRYRPRPRGKREPAVYIGQIPKRTRVSDFKAEVRGHDVAPMRVLWKGASRHAFLFFEHENDVEDALNKLMNLQISGKDVRVEKSAEREDRGEDNRRERGERGERGERDDRRDRVDRGDREYRPRRGDNDYEGGRGDGSGSSPRGGRNMRRYRGPPPRRPRPGRRSPSVFVGDIPKGTRVRDLKSLVRGMGVEPIRVLWRGGAGHTFLYFEKEEEVDEALKKLSNLEVNETEVRVERGGERPRNRGSGDEQSPGERGERPMRRRRPPRYRNDSEDDRPRERLPAIYIGSIPRGTRASEFKSQVRDHDLGHFRLILRLGTGHAYLLFQTEEEVEDALTKLENLEINEVKVRVDKSNRVDQRGDYAEERS